MQLDTKIEICLLLYVIFLSVTITSKMQKMGKQSAHYACCLADCTL
jgi:hypothetical protein